MAVSASLCLSSCNEASSGRRPRSRLVCHAAGQSPRLASGACQPAPVSRAGATTQQHGLSRRLENPQSRWDGSPVPRHVHSLGSTAWPARPFYLPAGTPLSSSHSLSLTLPLHAPRGRPSAQRPRKCQATLAADLSAVASEVSASLWAQPPSWAAALGVNAVVFSLGYPVLRSGLSASGIVSSFLLGVAAWKGFGPPGYTLVCLYFLLVSPTAQQTARANAHQ